MVQVQWEFRTHGDKLWTVFDICVQYESVLTVVHQLTDALNVMTRMLDMKNLHQMSIELYQSKKPYRIRGPPGTSRQGQC